MKGTVLILLCALALAHAYVPTSQRNTDGKACNCNPNEAKDVCAPLGTDGIFVAHEHCNQFYQCYNGIPVPFFCPANLVYNAEAEICDWPANVDCGDRPIVEADADNEEDCDDDADQNIQNSGENDDSSKQEEDTGNGGSDSGSAGGGNCDPSEAPAICAADESEGVLVAHESCNYFYKCSYGLPVAIKCPGNLLFNPSTDQCDWPENVECGDRIIPEVDDSSCSGNNGDCDNGGSDNGGTDNGGSDNGDSDSGTVGGGNCNPSEAPAICAADESEGVLVAHENCNQFYKCSYGVPVALLCPGNLLFNPNTDQCDWPENVDCGDRVIPGPEDNNGSDNGGSDNGGSDNGSSDNGGSDNGGSDNGSVGGCNCNPGEAPAICAADESEGVLVAHENCNQFYKCSYGVPVALLCPGNLLFNPYTDQCDWPENVDCGDRVIPGPEDNNGSDNGGSDNGGSDNGSSDNGGSDNGGSDNGSVGGCNCNPGEAPAICAADESEGVLVAHENCNQFYKCSYGVPVALLCPGNLLFNPYTDQCDWPENVVCGDRVIPGPEDNNGSDNGSSDNGGSDNGGSDNGGSDNGGSDNGSVGGGNCDPSEAPAICAADESEGVLVAHENCNQFYTCSNNLPVVLQCPGNLLFNPNTDQCDWPENVECGDRVIPGPEDNNGSDNGGSDNGGSDNGGSNNGGSDNGGSDNGGSDNGGSDNGSVGGGNCDPSEAPAICAADESEGVLVAHENCNQFYTCSNGLPVALQCPGNLLFNPSTDQCDWPENVECGDRVIPGPEDNNGSDNGGSDNGSSDNGGSNNGGSDNGGSDNGGSDNGSVGGGNCDPSEAPAICAADESEGVLVAHENCNQFYKCSNGLPVALLCPGNLLFNPSTDQCDWPENVECGDRVIPGPEDNNGSDNGGSDNGGSDNGSSDNGGSNNGGSDNGGSDNGGSDNGSVGGGNCDPSEAPAICAADESEGVLVAHENCNQFYKCSNGLPVALLCPGNLLFNPNTDQCDWPENVDCGDRVIPGPEDNNGSDNGGSDNGGSDNGSSDNGGSDNGGSDNGSVGGCNCNPGEAPAICAADESEGVLVAHEYCNQFYKCSYGVPVALLCPGNLLFNPYTDQCDWPENVDCGDRVIPGPEDNNGSDNGGSDNGSSDSGGSDNGGSDNGGTDNGSVGGGNCDPSEAPAICAADESEGVLIAHENCNQFYKCSYGLPVALQCPGNLLFNPNTDQCDWPENVECGDRVIPGPEDNNGSDNGGSDNGSSDNGGSDNGGSDNGGSDNGGNDNGGTDNGGHDNGGVGSCNCDPNEAPAICAADQSEGVLVANENCNYFYMCANGLPVATRCPGNLLFNPYTNQCDWPENVECGDRVIPDESDNEGSDNGGSDNGGSDNGGTDNGGIENGSSESEGEINDNPSQAPSICGSAGSDGVFVAHEQCNKYYMCLNGVPVAVKCPGTLLYNPLIGVCDWPRNVDCGDRVIPESEDSGSCNCNARQAPSICAADGSNGKQIAHEICNQFYVCKEGVPVARACPRSLLYDPVEEACERAQDVSCENRVLYYSLDKHLDARLQA